MKIKPCCNCPVLDSNELGETCQHPKSETGNPSEKDCPLLPYFSVGDRVLFRDGKHIAEGVVKAIHYATADIQVDACYVSERNGPVWRVKKDKIFNPSPPARQSQSTR